MYPKYPEDADMQLLDTTERAIEGDQFHVLIQSGLVSVSCTANTASTQAVTYPRPFTQGTTPDVVYSLKTIGNTASVIKWADLSASNESGFTLRIMTDTTQTLVFTWEAKGSAS